MSQRLAVYSDSEQMSQRLAVYSDSEQMSQRLAVYSDSEQNSNLVNSCPQAQFRELQQQSSTVYSKRILVRNCRRQVRALTLYKYYDNLQDLRIFSELNWLNLVIVHDRNATTLANRYPTANMPKCRALFWDVYSFPVLLTRYIKNSSYNFNSAILNQLLLFDASYLKCDKDLELLAAILSGSLLQSLHRDCIKGEITNKGLLSICKAHLPKLKEFYFSSQAITPGALQLFNRQNWSQPVVHIKLDSSALSNQEKQQIDKLFNSSLSTYSFYDEHPQIYDIKNDR